MFLRGIYKLVLVLLFVVPPSALYGAALPEFYGVYVMENGKYYEGKPGTEESSGDFKGTIQILIFEKNVAMAGGYSLYGLVYGRNKIIKTAEGWSTLPAKGRGVSAYNHWYWSIKHPVDTRIKPVKGEPEMLYMKPRKQLPPGYYAIRRDDEKWMASFFVDKARLPSDLSNSDLCVDIHVSKADKKVIYVEEMPCSQNISLEAGKPNGEAVKLNSEGKMSTRDAFKFFRDVKKLYREHKYDECIRKASALIKLEASERVTYKAYRIRGKCYKKKERYAAALKDFEKCVELNPNCNPPLK